MRTFWMASGLALAIAMAPVGASANERTVTGAAIGAGAGAIVAGPVGAVAGGVIGATVGGPRVTRTKYRRCWRNARGHRVCRRR